MNPRTMAVKGLQNRMETLPLVQAQIGLRTDPDKFFATENNFLLIARVVFAILGLSPFQVRAPSSVG
jgi:hypothetical protein